MVRTKHQLNSIESHRNLGGLFLLWKIKLTHTGTRPINLFIYSYNRSMLLFSFVMNMLEYGFKLKEPLQPYW